MPRNPLAAPEIPDFRLEEKPFTIEEIVTAVLNALVDVVVGLGILLPVLRTA